MNKQDVQEAYHAYMMPTYRPFAPLLVSGDGENLTDIDDKTYLDFTSGIGVNALGHGDPDWLAAICTQVHTLAHASNLYITPPAVLLAQNLCKQTDMAAAFFANSGAEANECAIKLARKASFDKYGEGRHEIITLVDSFHGRSLGSLAATGQAAMHSTFAPLPAGFRHVPQGDITLLENTIGPATCAVMLEIVQGEGGVIPLEENYLQTVQSLCRRKDLLLIIDEVQTGIGRTGSLCAFQQMHLEPDIITLAKGLGGGLPIGACLVNNKYKNTLNTGSHGSTFGGNPVVCAGANVVLNKVGDPAFLADVRAKSAYLEERLSTIQGIEKINRLGLMVGIVLKDKKAGDILHAAAEKGLLILTAKDNIRLLPPLTISKEAIDRACTILQTLIDA